MATPKIAILGGGYAGLMAAFRLAGKVGSRADITLIDGKAHFAERIRFHQLAAQAVIPERAYSDLLQGTGVRFMQGWATGLDPSARKVTIQRESGTEQLPYDRLFYALGSVSDKQSVPGVAEHAHSVGDGDEAIRLRAKLEPIAPRGGRVVVVGGGLTGIETATEIAEQYPTLKVQLLTQSEVGAGLSRKGQAYLRDVMEGLGITVQSHEKVQSVGAGALTTARGQEVPFDVCIWAGAFWVHPLARQAGLTVNRRDQIVVDSTLRSRSHPDIYAIGDAADLSEATTTPIRMACATALPMGAYAASHLSAELTGKATPAAFRFAYLSQCISLGRNAGLVQFVDAMDRPLERVLTGKAGAWVKELICRYTVFALNMERRFAGSFLYPQGAAQSEPLRPATTLK